MSFLVHWIPALAGGFVLLIAGLVLEARIRAERRAQRQRPESIASQPSH
jgi:hypothetical protein